MPDVPLNIESSNSSREGTDLDLNELLEYEAKANDAWLRQDGPVNPAEVPAKLEKIGGFVATPECSNTCGEVMAKNGT
jgi:hypothetical protein